MMDETEDGATATESPPSDEKTEFVRVLPEPDAETAKTTRLYELMIIFDPAEATRTWDKLAEWIKDLVEQKYKGTVLRLDKWAESKKLAYEMNGLKRGTYMLLWMRAKPEITVELERDLRLDERAMRHLLLVHEDEPPGVGKSAEEMEQAHGPREREERMTGGFGMGGGGGGFRRDRGDRDRDRGDRDRDRGERERY